jgi:hypothetical protein
MMTIQCHLRQGPFDGDTVTITQRKLPAGLALKTVADRLVSYKRHRCRGRREYVFTFAAYAQG